MFLIFFLIFVFTPILEIVLFIQVGGLIGVVPTILIVIVTAIVGSVMLRLQGSAVLRRTSLALRAGELPVDPVIDGMSLLVAGALLLTPGFFTDAVGFLLFVPPFRRALARRIFSHMIRSGHVFVMDGSEPGGPREPPPNKRGRRDPREAGRDDDAVIDVEYETVSENKPGHQGAEEEEEPTERDEDRGRPDPSSPWRR
jgi:UPF0716 protein FxsA